MRVTSFAEPPLSDSAKLSRRCATFLSVEFGVMNSAQPNHVKRLGIILMVPLGARVAALNAWQFDNLSAPHGVPEGKASH